MSNYVRNWSSTGVPPRSWAGIGVFDKRRFFLSNLPPFGGDHGLFFGFGWGLTGAGVLSTAALVFGFCIRSHMMAGISKTASTWTSRGSSPDGPSGKPARVFSDSFRWISLSAAVELGTHKKKTVCVDIHVHAAGSQTRLQNICGQQQNSPMADPIFGPKSRPQNGVQNWILF